MGALKSQLNDILSTKEWPEPRLEEFKTNLTQVEIQKDFKWPEKLFYLPFFEFVDCFERPEAARQLKKKVTKIDSYKPKNLC